MANPILTAVYSGPSIYVGASFSRLDLTVTVEFDNPNDNIILNLLEYDLSTTVIRSRGINTITVVEKYTGQQLTTTFNIYGVPFITEMSVKYVGKDIAISESFDPMNLIVSMNTVNHQDGTQETIMLSYPDDYTISEPGLVIQHIGDNIREVHYENPIFEWTGTFSITGIAKLTDFFTYYQGDIPRLIGDTINKSDVNAYAIYLLDIDGTTETKTLTSGEWGFFDAPIISYTNSGTIRTVYQNIIASIHVDYTDTQTLRLRCWYEGVKIKVGSSYDYDDVVALITYPNGNKRRVKSIDLDFTSAIVTEDGWNEFGVSYRNGQIKLKATFVVPGFKEDTLPEEELYVAFLDKTNYREIDFTTQFKDAFLFDDDIISISWASFLSVVQDINIYGTYIMTAPKLSGLSSVCDEDWEVLCINNKTLKANVIKSYKEEDKSWQIREQLKQRPRWTRIPKER